MTASTPLPRATVEPATVIVTDADPIGHVAHETASPDGTRRVLCQHHRPRPGARIASVVSVLTPPAAPRWAVAKTRARKER